MRKFQVLTVLAASTALAMGTVPAFAEDASVEVTDAIGELPVDEGAPVGYEDGSEVSDPADEVVDEVVDVPADETGEVVDEVVEGDPGTGDDVEITMIDDTGMVDDGGVVDDTVVDPVDEVVVKDDLGVPDEEVAVRDGDPLPYERNLDGVGDPDVIYYMTGGPAGEDFGGSAADDAAEAAADNAADKAMERVEVAANSNRTPGSAE